MNKYDKLFKPNMTTKEVDILFFSLWDAVKDDASEIKLLKDAHSKAHNVAEKVMRDKIRKMSAGKSDSKLNFAIFTN